MLGWNGDALEAEGFAYLADASEQAALPLSLPTTTGVKSKGNYSSDARLHLGVEVSTIARKRALAAFARFAHHVGDVFFTVSTTSASCLSKKWLAPSILL